MKTMDLIEAWDEYSQGKLISKDEHLKREAEYEDDLATIEAENAWVKKSEETTLEDMAFDRWEGERLG